MRILVTGATGYIGARLSQFLSDQGHEIIAVCSSKIPENKEWVDKIYKFIVGDIRKEETINKIIESQADAIIHLVSLDHHDSELEPRYVSEVNVQPTWNLLQSCIENSNNTVKKFIYFSTIHVYGKNQKGVINESQIMTPFNAYGLTHALSEEICNYYNRKSEIDCINIRLSNSYGEPVFHEAKCWSLIVNDLTKSAFDNGKIVLKSDGSAVRDFIHYSDICNGINLLLSTKESFKVSNTFHFSSSKSISMLDVAVEVRKVYKDLYKKDIPIFINSNEEWFDTNEQTEVNSVILNSLVEKKGAIFVKILSDGIKNLFNYLENKNANG